MPYIDSSSTQTQPNCLHLKYGNGQDKSTASYILSNVLLLMLIYHLPRFSSYQPSILHLVGTLFYS